MFPIVHGDTPVHPRGYVESAEVCTNVRPYAFGSAHQREPGGVVGHRHGRGIAVAEVIDRRQ